MKLSRQYYRSELRRIDKELSKLSKIVHNLRLKIDLTCSSLERTQRETDLQILIKKANDYFFERRTIVRKMELTKLKANPSDAEEDIPLYPMGEQIF